jgi:hypothetical protein
MPGEPASRNGAASPAAKAAEKSAVLDAMQRDAVKPPNAGTETQPEVPKKWTKRGIALWITSLCDAEQKVRCGAAPELQAVSARYLRIH